MKLLSVLNLHLCISATLSLAVRSSNFIVVYNYARNETDCYVIDDRSWCLEDTEPLVTNRVMHFEPDNLYTAQGCQDSPEWFLSRLSTKVPNRNPYTFPPYMSRTTYVYVVDTYIDTKHPDFEGRATNIFSNNWGTHNFHGTHVAGLIGSIRFGVNKEARIYGVQVLNDIGRGMFSKIVESLSFIRNHARGKESQSVINISISGSSSPAFDMAIQALYDAGLMVVVAAGNDGADSCNASPARSKYAFTVGATDVQDAVASFSNWGKCVNLYAPGSLIRSTIPDGKYGYASGTSMASPIVAGLASLYLGTASKRSPFDTTKFLTDNASRGLLSNIGPNSKNLLAYSPFKDVCGNEWWYNFSFLNQ